MEEKEVKNERILLCLNHLGGTELDYVIKAFEGNWVVPLGPDVDAFEEDLAAFFGEGSQMLALSCGTGAIHVALSILGVREGDEVMVQDFTFSATANPVRYLGATPVFVDSEPDTWNMDPALLDHAISERVRITGRRPKAIVPAYLYGMPGKIDEILEVARRWDIPVVEDAAEAMGSSYRGRRCGTFGRFGILSFNGNKMITTSGGGALICRNESDRRRALFFATQARENYPFYQHEHIGYNYRMSNICAAIGRGQMEVLDRHLAHHRRVQQFYRETIAGIPGVTLHDNPSAEYDSNFWLCAITLDEGVKVRGMESVTMPAGIEAPDPQVEALRLAMAADNIETRPLWKPMHLQPVHSQSPAYVNGVSQSLFRRGLCLPAGPWVGAPEMERIAATLRGALL